MEHPLNLTGSTWIGVTSLGTLDSSRTEKTKAIDVRSALCKTLSSVLKPKTQVYDVLCAGPRNRFTILSDKGPLIVHNCGYEGGVGAYITFATAYRLDLEEMADRAAATIPTDIWEEAKGMLKWTKQKRRSTFGLSDKAWMVCESFKRSWRAAHPATCALWKNISEAIKVAITRDKHSIPVGRLVVRREGAWLRIQLPSGRYLCYPSPRVDGKGQISYMGVHQYTRKWTRINSYSGKFVENITQAVARDVMANSMQRIDVDGALHQYQIEDGYPCLDLA